MTFRIRLRCMGKRILLGNLLVISVLKPTSQAGAADRFWIDRTGGGFTSTSNWQDRFVALDGDFAHFGVSDLFNPQANYTVTFGTNIKNQLLLVEDDLVTFDLNGHSYETTATGTTMLIGTVPNRTAQFAITDGLVIAPLNSHIEVGSAGTGGFLTVTTAGLLIGSPLIRVGAGANGTLTINNGGDVIASDVDIAFSPGNTATATVTGASSSLLAAALNVGKAASGTLDVLASGRVDSSSGTIASIAGSTATVIVNGGNSQWNDSGQLKIGNAGTGTLNISAGGKVQNTHGFIGFDGGGGTVSVSGTNSRWLNSGVVQVGLFGEGALTITDGGMVQGNEGNIGGFSHNGTAQVSGAGATWNAGAISVGFTGQGQLSIENGGTVSSSGGSVGALSGSNGVANVTGLNSTWSNAGNLTVGDGGTGTLNISGTTVTNTGSLTVGNTGSGTLTITAGGGISNTVGHVGLAAGGVGTVTLDGTNSQWTNSSELRVGEGGAGTMNVLAGGRVQNATGFLGYGANGTAHVDGVNSQWINSGTLQVGLGGPGSLNVTGGGHVESSGGTIAINAPSTSTATVSGAGSTWTNSGSIIVGLSGNGALTITSGGHVSNTDASIAELTGSTGTVIVGGQGSNWTINGALRVGVNAFGGNEGGTGVLRIQSGGSVNVLGNVVVGDSAAGHMNQLILEGGTFTAPDIDFVAAFRPFFWTAGTLHVGSYHGNLIVPNGGVLAPGNSAGTTLISGDCGMAAGAALEIEIGGIANGSQYDVVNVSGNTILGGSLQLALLNGFAPSPGNTFVILQATGSITGMFTNVANGQRLFTRDGLGSFLVNYGPGSAFNPKQIVLSSFLVGGLPGDFNHDGVVDAADYVVWRKSDGTSINYGVWRSHFGQAAAAGSQAISNLAIPEPGTLSPLIAAIYAFSFRTPRYVAIAYRRETRREGGSHI